MFGQLIAQWLKARDERRAGKAARGALPRTHEGAQQMSNREPAPYDLGPAECIRENDKAIFVLVDSDSPCAVDAVNPGAVDPRIWIPKVALHADSEVLEAGDMGELVVQSWFASKRGW
jgi:hypothetical protein